MAPSKSKTPEATSLLKSREPGTFLKAALARKVRNNPRLSMRWLAEKLGLSPALLSQCLNGKRTFPEDKTSVLASTLSLSPSELAYLQLLLDGSRARLATGRRVLTSELELQRSEDQTLAVAVPLDEEHPLLDPFVQAVYAAFDLENFDGSASFIAGALGFSRPRVERALARLLSGRLARRDRAGKWTATPEQHCVTIESPGSERFREYYLRLTRLSANALTTFPASRYAIGAEVLCFAEADLPKVVAELKRFHQRNLVGSQQSEAPKRVYLGYYHLFPVEDRLESEG